MKSPRTGPALGPVSSGCILPTRSLGPRTQARAAAGPHDGQAGARAAQDTDAAAQAPSLLVYSFL